MESECDGACDRTAFVLVGWREGCDQLKEGSRIRSIYGRAEAIEEYPCNFGFNPPYLRLLKGGILKW